MLAGNFKKGGDSKFRMPKARPATADHLAQHNVTLTVVGTVLASLTDHLAFAFAAAGVDRQSNVKQGKKRP